MKKLNRLTSILGAIVLSVMATTAFAAEAFMPDCYRPGSPDTPMLTFEKREGPYKLAFVNGFFGIPWRNQSIQSLKAWAKRPENAKNIKELRIVSTGTEVAAQIGAVDNFIQAGFDAIIFIAVNPNAFTAVQRRAKQAGTLLIAFDNVLDSDDVVGIQPSQIELESKKAQGMVDLIPGKKGKVVEVRGDPGNATDRDRHIGARKVLDATPGIEVIEVVGNWDQGKVQQVVSDVIAAHGKIDGVVCQHGSAGVVNALKGSNHPMVPIGGDCENGFRVALLESGAPGVSADGSPGMSAVAMQAAIAMFNGYAIPATVNMPVIPVAAKDLKPGVNVFPEVAPTFNTLTGYEACGITFTPEELSSYTPENN